MKTIQVLGFSGSLRKGSYNTALLRLAAEVLPANMTLETFDLTPIPMFNEDVRLAGVPEPVKLFKERIAAADALLIATPEYNYSIPGVLKNAIDWASRPPETSPLDGKPLAIMGGGGAAGTARAQCHLRQVAAIVNIQTLNRPEVFIPRVWEKFDANGKLLDDSIRDKIGELLKALAEWTLRLKVNA
jgi:chromate reductase, NAD(P)H dehydrogenase (quinone)